VETSFRPEVRKYSIRTIFQQLATATPYEILSLMPIATGLFMAFSHVLTTARAVLFDLSRFLAFMLPVSRRVGRRESFLRKQLARFEEPKVQPQRATDAVRFVMFALARLFEWRGALRVVKPDTFIRWHRKGFQLFWRWKSRSPKLPSHLRQLIRAMAAENSIWGEARIADELRLKLGIRVSPRSVAGYDPLGMIAHEGHPALVRTVRRECLDFVIPFSEAPLKRTLVEWVATVAPYSLAARLAELWLGVTISPMGVWRVAQRLGQAAAHHAEDLSRYHADSRSTGAPTQTAPPVAVLGVDGCSLGMRALHTSSS
jgi:hypothetical protein